MDNSIQHSAQNILLDSLNRLAVLIDPDGTILMLNKIAAEYAGNNKQFLIGKNMFDHIPDDFSKETKNKLRKIIKQGEIVEFEETFRGEIFMITINPVFESDKLKYVAIYSTNITKEKHAKKELEEKKRKYYSIFNSAGDAIFLMKDDIFIDCNKKAMTIFDCKSPDQLTGKTPDHFSPELQPDGASSRDKILLNIQTALKGESEPFYFQFLKYNHTPFDASVSLNRVELEEGLHLLAIIRDITAEKKSEEQIRRLGQLQKSIIENANVWVNVVDNDGNIILWNTAAAKISGYSKKEVLGHKKIWEWLYPEQVYRQQIFKKTSRTIHAGEAADNMETTILTKSGKNKIINWFSRNLTNEKGETNGSVAMGIDVTMSELTQKDLKKSEHRYRLLAENTTDVIWTMDLNLNFTFVSPSIFKLRGYTVEQTLKQSIKEVLTTDSYHKVRQLFDEEMTKLASNNNYEKSSLTLELQVSRKKNDPIWVEVNSSFFLDDYKKPIGIIGVARNIHEKKIAETAKNEIEAQLRQSQKLEAVGRLAGGIAHDFNNMLTAIIVNTDLLLLYDKIDKRISDGLNEIKKSSHRAASLTRQLLAFSKKQVHNPQILDMASLINKLEKMLIRIIDPKVTLLSTHQSKLNKIKADHGQIEQVIMNLVINASDSIEKSGEINILAKNKIIAEDYCMLHSEAYPGEFISVTIKDNGKGMEEEELQHIFEPFYTTKNKGTGLGLSVVHGLIKQHNGWITVNSSPGKGTEFEFFVPIFKASETQAENQDSIAEKIYHGNEETILLIEDEESIRNIVKIALTKCKYQVLVARDYDEAKKLYKKNKKNIDLILSDIFLINKNAFDLLDELNIPDRIKIILTSGYSSDEKISENIAKLNIPFIQKPFPVNSLLKLIKQTLYN